MIRFTSILYFLVILVTSCPGGEPDHPNPSVTNKLRDTIKNTDSVFVYEGLPHQMFESELLKTEKKRKDITTIAGYPFYTPKVQVQGKAEEIVKSIITDPNKFIRFQGEKLCGGFHPDYAVEWSDGDKTYSILFCYGCGEVLIVDRKNTYRYDFKFSDDFKKIFTTFGLKRPK